MAYIQNGQYWTKELGTADDPRYQLVSDPSGTIGMQAGFAEGLPFYSLNQEVVAAENQAKEQAAAAEQARIQSWIQSSKSYTPANYTPQNQSWLGSFNPGAPQGGGLLSTPQQTNYGSGLLGANQYFAQQAQTAK